MWWASSLARKSAAPVMSSGFGILPAGVPESTTSRRPAFHSGRASSASVSMNPGANVLTRTVGASALA